MTWPPAPPPPPPSLPPPGWYPDPSGNASHRWWDGVRWSEHVGTPPPTIESRPLIVTPTGTMELAGWWRRFGGYVLDAVIVGVPQLIVSFEIGLTQRDNIVPGTTVWHFDTTAQLLIVGSAVLIALAYPYLFLRYRGQTVGMMAAGVRALDRATGTSLAPAQAGRRVLAFFGLVTFWLQISVLIGYHHVYGPEPVAWVLFRLLGTAALLATALWPLGNPLNQTLQDKAAGTVVVRSRR